jgi:hypothetical protein
MKRFKSCLLASAGLVMLAAALSFTAPGRAVAQRVKDDCVRICDTASNPLHVIVQGITRVNGDVTINNENAIATTVTGPVRVTGTPREPLYVIQQKKPENIFQEQVSLKLKKGEVAVVREFVVPPGKFLEIKYASGTATTEISAALMPYTDFSVTIRVTQPNNNLFNFPLTKQTQWITEDGVAFGSSQVGGNQVGIFGDSGGTIRVVLKRGGNLGSLIAEFNLELAISGEYHDF